MGLLAKVERHATQRLLVARAKELRRAGYVLLVSVGRECEHWTGYTAFHQDRPEEAPIALECSVPLRGDRMAIFELDG